MTQAPKTLNFVDFANGRVHYTINSGSCVDSRKLGPNNVFTKYGFTYQYDPEKKCINVIDGNSVVDTAVKTTPLRPLRKPEPAQSEFSINQRFEFLDKFTNMVLDGVTASAIVTGEGGLGKCLEKNTKVKVKIDDNLYNELKRMGVI